MQQANEIKIEKHGEVTILNIQGDITASSEPFLNEAYKDANDQGARKILLEFDKDTYINSGGIALLILILAHTKRNNQQVGITGLSDHFKKIFNMVGITKFAKIHDTVENALEVWSSES